MGKKRSLLNLVGFGKEVYHPKNLEALFFAHARWPEAERLTHSATFRRGFCRPLNCYTWVHVNFLGQEAEVVKLRLG